MNAVNIGQQAQDELKNLFRELFITELIESFNQTGVTIKGDVNNFSNSIKGKIERLIEEEVKPLHTEQKQAIASFSASIDKCLTATNDLHTQVSQAVSAFNVSLSELRSDTKQSCLTCHSKISTVSDELKTHTLEILNQGKRIQFIETATANLPAVIKKQNRFSLYLNISQSLIILSLMVLFILK